MKRLLILPLALVAALAGGAVARVQGTCGPFIDVTPAFCPFVLELYYLGITVGTSPTTFSPDDPLTRGQAAVFVAKPLDQSLARSSRRAALGHWWTTTPHYDVGLGVTAVGQVAQSPAADGADVWVPSDNSVLRVRASDGKLLETWTGAQSAAAVLVAMGRVFVAGQLPGNLYMIDPAAPAGSVTTVATGIGQAGPQAIAFDGNRIWTANCCLQWIPPPPPDSISIITPGTWSFQTITTGFSHPTGLVFDGTNMWVADSHGLLRLDSSGAIIQTVALSGALKPVYDGANIWVPNAAGLSVVRAATGEIVATLAPQSLPTGVSEVTAAFDGRRVLVASNGTLQLWDAQTLTPLGGFATGYSYSGGVCSDGINFWIALTSSHPFSSVLARF